jgi:tRNA pseudouridine55 synthase
VSWDGSDPERPIAILEIVCSAGTYVRSLARDLGEAVGSAAYLGALTRTASGPFRLEDAVALDDLRTAAAESPAGLLPHLKPLDTGLEAFPVVDLSDEETTAIARGQFVRPAGGLPGPADHYRLRDPRGRLVAIATAESGRLAPDKVFVAPVSASPVTVP